MRQYEKTHPWITFQVDLRDVPYSLWMKLGECASKIEHVSRVPLVHESAEDLYKVYLAKGVHATTAIEGNTLSEEDVLRHLDGELELPPRASIWSRRLTTFKNWITKEENRYFANKETMLKLRPFRVPSRRNSR